VSDSASKTEKASPERRRKAREEGQFARGRDAGGIAATMAVLLVIGSMGPQMAENVRLFSLHCFTEPYDLMHGSTAAIWQRTAATLAGLIFPIAGSAAAAGVAIGFAEAGFKPRLELIMPKFSRLDPIAKLKNIVDPKNALTEVALSSSKIGVVGWIAYSTLRDAYPVIARLAGSHVAAGAAAVATTASTLTFRACLALAVLSALDFGQNWFRIEKQLMMSREDLKDEHKQSEGDQRLKHRARARARDRMKRGLAKVIPTADVVVTNPTHIAVALRYRPKDGAPVVVAKGYDDIALHMRKLAKECDVPVIENKPLARAIAADVRVGRAIPAELYGAVAEVLAFVYRLRKRNPLMQASS
jgi:flagellar biosynthetic protein FlhB